MSNDRFKFRVWDDRFKFRVWDKNDQQYKAMFVSQTIRNDGTEVEPPDEDYIIEQCTGLRDKNGNLIYEGDIIRTDDNPNHDTTISWIQDEGRFWFGFYGAATIHKYGTIIGNIHEGVKEK